MWCDSQKDREARRVQHALCRHIHKWTTNSSHGRLYEETNIITKMTKERLGLNFVQSYTYLKTVNAPSTLACGVAQRLSITIQKWKGMTNLTVAPQEIFEIILGKRILQALPHDDRTLPPTNHVYGAGRVMHGTSRQGAKKRKCMPTYRPCKL